MQEKLYIYIDESGDTGIKFSEGSSRFFVVALVTIKNADQNHISNIIQKTVGQKEIKFSKSSLKNKLKFFSKVKQLRFTCDIFIFEKIVLKLNHEESIIYSLKESVNEKYNYSVFIDGLNKKSFSAESVINIKKIFKNIDRVYLVDSKKNYLIQLADMLAGLIYAIYRDKNDYIKLLKSMGNKIKTTHIK